MVASRDVAVKGRRACNRRPLVTQLVHRKRKARRVPPPRRSRATCLGSGNLADDSVRRTPGLRSPPESALFPPGDACGRSGAAGGRNRRRVRLLPRSGPEVKGRQGDWTGDDSAIRVHPQELRRDRGQWTGTSCRGSDAVAKGQAWSSRVGRGRQGSGVVATGRAWSSRVGRGHHGSGRPPAAHPPMPRPSERSQPTPRAPPGWPRGAARRSVGRAARSPCAGPSSLPTTGRDRARSGRPACPDGCRGCSR
jgi:hypothetical protein